MSTGIGNILLEKEILLESGTNELEVLVFDVADFTFGINVAKVREVLPATEITSLPMAHSSIRGVFKLRDRVIPCVSLLDHLGIESTREKAESKIILSDFNQQQTAFLVDDVERIHRMSWENILSVPGLDSLANSPVTALCRCDDRLIVMLDFEMILDDVTEQYFRTDAVDNPLGLPREKLRIMLAEDSPTVREAIGTTLNKSGYTQTTFCENGAEAWKWLEQQLQQGSPIEDIVDLVISDVEMPQVDGFHLTKRIKQHAQLKQVPVLLYSSIITPDNCKKGKAVGADAQVSKPELSRVVELADELISTAQREHRGAALRDLSERVESAQGTTEPTSSASSPPATEPAPTAPQEEQARIATPPAPTETPAPPRDRPADAPTEKTAESPASTPPAGVNPHLWTTFRRELTGRTAHLDDLFRQAGGGDLGDEILNDVLRTLHTVKSASMVVPVEPVTRCTHLVETLLDTIRNDRRQWPAEVLGEYLQWLTRLVSPAADTNATLADSPQLEGSLAGMLATMSG